MKLKITKGETFRIEADETRFIVLDWQEWMDLRRMQNALIRTEPTDQFLIAEVQS